mgnify:CR=1 FL=1
MEKCASEINEIHKETASRYVGIASKVSIWSLLLMCHIVSLKYINAKCGSEANAKTFGGTISDDPDILQRKKWFILYWLGLVIETLLGVFLMYIISSETITITECFLLTLKTAKRLYDTIYTSSVCKLLKKWILKFQIKGKPVIPKVGSYMTVKNAYKVILTYYTVQICLRIHELIS